MGNANQGRVDRLSIPCIPIVPTYTKWARNGFDNCDIALATERVDDRLGRKEEAMTTFDLAEVRAFTADLDARMNRCDNGEGMECANLDGTLRHYAELCCQFSERVRQWGRRSSTGKLPLTQKWRNSGSTRGSGYIAAQVRCGPMDRRGRASVLSCKTVPRERRPLAIGTSAFGMGDTEASGCSVGTPRSCFDTSRKSGSSKARRCSSAASRRLAAERSASATRL